MGFNYGVVTIDQRLVEEVRTSLKAPDYEHPAVVEDRATGYGPCRACLKKFKIGSERRILFTYDPFREVEPYPLPGPIYVHAERCTSYDRTAGFPTELADLPLTFNAYGPGRELIAQERVHDQDEVEPTIERLLARRSVEYVHVRNTEAGCFICSLTRTEADSPTSGYDDTAVDHPSWR
jgi:hypothetical protein